MATEDPANRLQIEYEQDGLPRQQIFDSIHGSWQSYYANIVDVLNGRAELIVKPSEVKLQMMIIDAAMQSAASGRTVDLDTAPYLL